MNIGRTITPRNRSAWRAWLRRNHASASEIWLIFHKKSTGKQTLSLDAAVEEALCFGWIDGQLKSLDHERFALRFTPRRKGSNWSARNIERANRLIAEGKMTPAGLASIDPRLLQGKPSPREYQTRLSPELQKQLKADRLAWEAFQRLAPSHRRQYVGWIMDAKQPATRERRLGEAMAQLRKGKPPGVK